MKLLPLWILILCGLIGFGIGYFTDRPTRAGFVRGCSTAYTGIYQRLGLKLVDKDSLHDFCELKFEEAK